MNGLNISLKGAAAYIRLYRGKTFVIKLGGKVLANPDFADAAAEQCALLSDLDIRVILVHGGGAQASDLSRNLGLEPKIIAGRRVTDDAALEVVKMTYAGKVNVEMVSALRRHSVRAVGLTGIDAGLVLANRRPPVVVRDDDGKEQLVDFGNVGDITRVDTGILTHLLEGGYMPAVSCLGADEKGNPLNINADNIAEALAVALQAKKLIFLTDQAGVLRDRNSPATLVPFADAQDLAGLLETGVISGGMRLKVEACIRAATNGVKRTHIIDGTAPFSLLMEVFTGEGCGTMIVGEREKQIYQEEFK